MINNEEALNLMQEALKSLKRSGLVEKEMLLDEETALLGEASPLDSISFITFLTEFEDKLNDLTNGDYSLVINDIHEFNLEESVKPYLSVGSFARYIEKLTTESQ
jgi:hypothetical protein